MVLYVLLPSLTSNVYFEPKFDEFVITGGDFTVFDPISDQSSQSTLAWSPCSLCARMNMKLATKFQKKETEFCPHFL